MPDEITHRTAARRAREFLTAVRDSPGVDSDSRRWANTGMRWAWLAGYLAAQADASRAGPPTGNPFSSRSIEEEYVPEPTHA